MTSFFARQICNLKDNDCITKFNSNLEVRLKSAEKRRFRKLYVKNKKTL